MASRPQGIKRVADLLAMNLAADPITVRDKIVKIGMDTSPQRRKALRAYYQACDDIAIPNDYSFTYCDMALEIWCKDGLWKVGSYDRHTEEWEWFEGHAKEAGIKTPNTIENNEPQNQEAPPPQLQQLQQQHEQLAPGQPAPEQAPDLEMAQPEAPAS